MSYFRARASCAALCVDQDTALPYIRKTYLVGVHAQAGISTDKKHRKQYV